MGISYESDGICEIVSRNGTLYRCAMPTQDTPSRLRNAFTNAGYDILEQRIKVEFRHSNGYGTISGTREIPLDKASQSDLEMLTGLSIKVSKNGREYVVSLESGKKQYVGGERDIQCVPLIRKISGDFEGETEKEIISFIEESLHERELRISLVSEFGGKNET